MNEYILVINHFNTLYKSQFSWINFLDSVHFFLPELYGATNWESAQIDVVGELMYDLTKPLAETIIFEKDEAKKVYAYY